MRGLAASGLAIGAVLAFGACGGDGDGGGGEKAAAEPVRCTPASPTARKLLVRPRWKAGDERTMAIEKIRKEGSAPERRATLTAQLRVLEADPGSGRATLRWSVGATSLARGQNLPAEALERLKGDTEILAIEYTTDADGAYDRIQNVPEVRDQWLRMLDTLEEPDDTPREREIVRQLRETLSTETFIQAAVGEEAQLMHNLYGVEIEPSKDIVGPYELENPFGGDPLPATARIELADPEDRNGCAAIDLTVDPDKEGVAKMMQDFVAQFGPSAPDVSGVSARLRNELRFAYDPGSGWVVRAELTKRITVSDGRQTRRQSVRTVVTSR